MLFTFSVRKKQEARDALTELDAILSSKPVTMARKRLSRAEAELGGFLIASAVHVKPEQAHS